MDKTAVGKPITRKQMMIAIGIQILIGLTLVSSDSALESIDSIFHDLYSLLPNYAWSRKSSFPVLARVLYVLSMPIFPMSCLYWIYLIGSDIRVKIYTLFMRVVGFMFSLLTISLTGLIIFLYSGEGFFNLPLGTSSICLIFFSWAPAFGSGLLLAAGIAVINHALKPNIRQNRP